MSTPVFSGGGSTSGARAILQIDLDCFYAQVEMLRGRVDPDRPLAVTQKFLVVTANYAARAAGVGKLMPIDRAKAKCPELLLTSGEDLTPYREASAAIFTALTPFGPVQKLGLDEMFVDVTVAARELLRADGAVQWSETTRIHTARHGTTSAEAQARTGTDYRPQDLRASDQVGAAAAAAAPESAAAEDDEQARLLRAASHVAVRCKAAIRAQSGLTASVGVASSKLLAKLCCGLHKPDGLTALPQSEARAFLAPLDVRVLPGVGGAATGMLHSLGLTTVGDLGAISTGALHRALSELPSALLKTTRLSAARLTSLAAGLDLEPVVPSGPPKSLSVEDSFRGASSFEVLKQVVAVLVPDLLERLEHDRASHARRACTLLVRWRHSGSRTMNHPHGAASGHSMSRSTPMPHLVGRKVSGQRLADEQLLAEAALAVLREQLAPAPFTLTLLGLGATNFEPAPRQRGGGAGQAGEAGQAGQASGSGAGAGGAVLVAPSPLPTAMATAAAARAAAELQRSWRADYAVADEARLGRDWVVCSKAAERRIRELGGGSTMGGDASGSCAGRSGTTVRGASGSVSARDSARFPKDAESDVWDGAGPELEPELKVDSYGNEVEEANGWFECGTRCVERCEVEANGWFECDTRCVERCVAYAAEEDEPWGRRIGTLVAPLTTATSTSVQQPLSAYLRSPSKGVVAGGVVALGSKGAVAMGTVASASGSSSVGASASGSSSVGASARVSRASTAAPIRALAVHAREAAASEAPTCPVCGQVLRLDNAQVNSHIDVCLNGSLLPAAPSSSKGLAPSGSAKKRVLVPEKPRAGGKRRTPTAARGGRQRDEGATQSTLVSSWGCLGVGLVRE